MSTFFPAPRCVPAAAGWKHSGWRRKSWGTMPCTSSGRLLHTARGLSVHAVPRVLAVYHDGVGSGRGSENPRCFRCLDRKGAAPKEEELKVVVLAGDGSTYDMALSATSAAIYRNLDFYYFCYDNEAYGNTGVQFSSATPYGARTSTSPCSIRSGRSRRRKSSLKSGVRIGRRISQPCRRGIH